MGPQVKASTPEELERETNQVLVERMKNDVS